MCKRKCQRWTKFAFLFFVHIYSQVQFKDRVDLTSLPHAFRSDVASSTHIPLLERGCSLLTCAVGCPQFATTHKFQSPTSAKQKTSTPQHLNTSTPPVFPIPDPIQRLWAWCLAAAAPAVGPLAVHQEAHPFAARCRGGAEAGQMAALQLSFSLQGGEEGGKRELSTQVKCPQRIYISGLQHCETPTPQIMTMFQLPRWPAECSGSLHSAAIELKTRQAGFAVFICMRANPAEKLEAVQHCAAQRTAVQC